MNQQDPTTVEAAPQAMDVGRSLRDARTARGISLEDVSARLKYSVRQLQALEEERWEQLPTGVSLRGMIRNYAKLIGTDVDSIIAALAGHAAVADRHTGRELGASAAVGGENSPSAPSTMPWGWLLTILAVVIAVAAYAFWRGWLPRELLTLSGIKHYFHR
ncbi:RodZ family helix-turn-helix domain-containing protein [Bordetella sp. FB-8]|uniref:helix-turn-helix domain-containing protein n=1 Tax=Bordetella sp. FB-8 TaxID=1159870 RepID=UPI0003818FB2|nr:helix-turn-helix transcriptional regulator [Bordetella sp. FB-8]